MAVCSKTLTLALAGLLLWASPASALSVKQVLELRAAGVGDDTIRSMIQAEIDAANRSGAVGRPVQLDNKKTVVVYSAKSAPGAPPPGQTAETTVVEAMSTTAGVAAIDSPPPGSGGAYVLQLGSFRTQGEADDLAAQLADKQIQSETAQVNLGEKGVWWRVFIAGFPSKARASARGEEARATGLVPDYWISR